MAIVLKCDFCSTEKTEDPESQYDTMNVWVNVDGNEKMHFCYDCQSTLDLISEKQIIPEEEVE